MAAPANRAEQIERLEKFRDGLKVVPPENFNMSFWLVGNEPDKLFDYPEESCGTAGCAVGWMPVIFKGEFVYELSPHERSSHNIYPTDSKLRVNEGAAMHFLGLTREQTDMLFFPQSYSFKPVPHGFCGITSSELSANDPPLEPSDRKLLEKILPCHVAHRLDLIIQDLKAKEAAEQAEKPVPTA